MRTMPGLGAKVRFPGNSAIGACEGEVIKHYPGYRGKNEDGEFVVEDKVVIRVDATPFKWPYAGSNSFCADIAKIELSPISTKVAR